MFQTQGKGLRQERTQGVEPWKNVSRDGTP